jgi:gliding motility-associated transport system ATP-binding protein
MSIEVIGVTKKYGEQRAVDNLSFEVKKGQILGFLGPNGAGKSTTMKIITGYLHATEGITLVNGFDPVVDPVKVKGMLGYLPEHNPLYPELYVREYLGIMANIQRVSNPSKKVGEVIELTGLTRECKKKVGALSKGFRQRVGLAQALIHDPEVLILDEPTSGLDPNQLAEIRGLIKSLGTEKTVIFSTHIMQEVQAICDRVVIIDSGKMVIDKPIDYLVDLQTAARVVEVQFDRKINTNTLLRIKGITRIEEGQEDGEYRIYSKKNVDLRADIFRYAVEKSLILLAMHQQKSSVEDVFQYLTKKQV